MFDILMKRSEPLINICIVWAINEMRQLVYEFDQPSLYNHPIKTWIAFENLLLRNGCYNAHFIFYLAGRMVWYNYN